MKAMHQVMRETAAGVFKEMGKIVETMEPTQVVADSLKSKKRQDKLWEAMTTTPEHIARPLITHVAKVAGHTETESSPCEFCKFIDSRKKNG